MREKPENKMAQSILQPFNQKCDTRKASITDAEVIGTTVARPVKTAAKKAAATSGAGPTKTLTMCGLTVK